MGIYTSVYSRNVPNVVDYESFMDDVGHHRNIKHDQNIKESVNDDKQRGKVKNVQKTEREQKFLNLVDDVKVNVGVTTLPEIKLELAIEDSMDDFLETIQWAIKVIVVTIVGGFIFCGLAMSFGIYFFAK